MASALSIHRAPPAVVPLRFLLTAPWFAVAAGGLLLWAGPEALDSRWTGAVLAVTHLLTLGFMGHAMLGALLQLLPVAFGVPLPRIGAVAAVAHPALALGALCLSAAFLAAAPVLFAAAALLLALALGVYLAAVAIGILRQRMRDPLARVISVALLGLLVTVLLGVLLASGLAGAPLPLLALTHLHATWGIVGWTLLLVLGAALALVPMFQMTSSYPRWLRGGFSAAMLVALIAWSVALWFEWNALRRILQWLLAGGAGTIGIATLVLQQRGRRRLQPDVTFSFWRLGMLCLCAAVALWIVGETLAVQSTQPYALLLGVMLLPGFAFCVIAGMLYKIVPFLLWLTLQMHSGGRPPSVKEILPEERGEPQYWTHMCAIVLLAAAVTLWSGFVYPAAMTFIASSAMLGGSLTRAARFARTRMAEAKPLPRGADRSSWKSIS